MVKVGIDDGDKPTLAMKLFETGQLSGKTTFCRNGKVDELSWAESCSQADRLATFLIERDIVKKKIAIVGSYSIKSYITFLACAKVGNAALVLDAGEPGRFEFIGEIGADCIWLDQDICSEDVDFSKFETVTKIMKTGTLPTKVSLLTHTNMEEILLDTIQYKPTDIAAITAVATSVKTTDVLCYSTTSGTTGKPKIIQFPNKFCGEVPAFDNDPAGLCDLFRLFGVFGFCETLKFLKQKANLGAIGNFVSHFYYNVTIYNCGVKRQNLTILDQHNHEHTAEMIKRNELATLIFYLPRCLDFIADKGFPKHDLSHVRLILTIGSMITKEIYARIESAFITHHGSKPVIISAFGTTECGSMPLRCGIFDKRDDQINTVGQVMHGGGVRILDLTTGAEITAANTVGEVELFSPFRMIGYIGHEQNITWIKTGDIGHYSDKGYVVLVGRVKEQLVLRNTKKTNATTVDMEVQKCGLAITEVATVGIRNEDGYDDIHIFIRCDESRDEAVKDYCNTTIKSFLVDAPILHFHRDALPRLVNGKYDKKGLTAMAKGE